MDDYLSNYSGAQIDEAVGRALPGGRLEALIADKAPDGLISETNGFATAEAEDAWLLSVISGMENDTAKLVRSYHQTNISPFGGGYYQYFIYKATSSYAVIEMKHYGSANGAVLGLRTLYNGNLSPWAWNNPPMQLGVEYRTTEFYLGKPVYAKEVSYGALPNGYGDIQHGIPNILNIVRADGRFYNPESGGTTEHYQHMPVFGSSGLSGNDHLYFTEVSRTYIAIYAGARFSNFVLKVSMYYTKTTD